MTAVEWLVEQVPRIVNIASFDILEQALEMEKEQITDAWENGFREFYDGSSTPEEYYNTKFKSE